MAQATLRTSFLGGLPSQVVSSLLEGARIREIPAGIVFIDPERPNRCGIIVTGLARVYTLKFNGSQVTQRRVGPGSAVGVRAIVGRRNRVSVQAITDVEFLEVHAERMLQLARSTPALALAIAEELDQRLDDTQVQAENSGGTVMQRVAEALLDLSVEGAPLEVRISQERLGEVVGASRERVGHELRRLAEAGVIELTRGRVSILDALQLHAIAHDPYPRKLWTTPIKVLPPAQ